MYSITARVEGIETVEGNYKNKLIAEKHKRRLEKKYLGTVFKIEQVNKRARKRDDFYAVVKRLGEKEGKNEKA